MMDKLKKDPQTPKVGVNTPKCQPKPDSDKMVYAMDRRTFFQVDPKYKVSTLIGRGAYGLVASGENTETKQKIAIKLIKDLFQDPGEAKRELRQIKILKFLKHKNIVGLLDIMRIEDSKNFNEIYLVLEYMQSNLKKLIESKIKLTQPMIKFILFQMLDGLHYMHSADIIHRDLKPENILINSKCELKIADMNLARKEDQKATRYVVTRPYRALQVLLCCESYTKSIDIWSIGCIFAELIGRTVLFEGSDCIDQLKRFVAVLGKPNKELYQNIDPVAKDCFEQMIKEIPDRSKIDWKILFPNADQQGLDLLDHMLVYDPKIRYTAEQCLNHPYLKQLRKKTIISKCPVSFDFSFDEIPMKIESLKTAIYQVAESFNPESTLATKRERKDEQPAQGLQMRKRQKIESDNI